MLQQTPEWSCEQVMRSGLLIPAAAILLWRSLCEFYVAVFRMSEDLHALRQVTDAKPQLNQLSPR